MIAIIASEASSSAKIILMRSQICGTIGKSQFCGTMRKQTVYDEDFPLKKTTERRFLITKLITDIDATDKRSTASLLHAAVNEQLILPPSSTLHNCDRSHLNLDLIQAHY